MISSSEKCSRARSSGVRAVKPAGRSSNLSTAPANGSGVPAGAPVAAGAEVGPSAGARLGVALAAVAGARVAAVVGLAGAVVAVAGAGGGAVLGAGGRRTQAGER